MSGTGVLVCLDYSVTCVLLDRYSAFFSFLPFCRDCLARSCQRSKLGLRDIFNSASLGILKSNDAFVKLTQVKHEEDGDYYPFATSFPADFPMRIAE